MKDRQAADRGPFPAASPGSGEPVGAHQPLHRATGDRDLFSIQLQPHLPRPIDALVRREDSTDLDQQRLVATLPPNTDVLAAIKSSLGNADQKAATYMSDLAPDIHDAPVAPPPGASTFQTIMQRYVENVQFGRQSPADAAKQFFDEAKSQLKS